MALQTPSCTEIDTTTFPGVPGTDTSVTEFLLTIDKLHFLVIALKIIKQERNVQYKNKTINKIIFLIKRLHRVIITTSFIQYFG